jgi:fluoride ion exporter CrcB/FEX
LWEVLSVTRRLRKGQERVEVGNCHLFFFGAALGASLRWLPGIRLDSLFRANRSGNLAANLIGACVFGFGIAVFASFSSLAPE